MAMGMEMGGMPQEQGMDLSQMPEEELMALLQELAQDPEGNAEMINQIKNVIAQKKFGLGAANG